MRKKQTPKHLKTSFEQKTYEELVNWAAGEILQNLINGNFRDGIWSVCQSVIMWYQAQEK